MPTTEPHWDDRAHASRLRARRRRGAEARAAALRSLRHRGVAVFAAAMTLSVGGALAHQTAGSSSSGAKVVRAGAKGASVKAIQAKLGVAADGIFGPRTRRAVRAFQRRNGLTVDGIVGPQTLAALGLSALPAGREAKRERKARTGTSVLETIAQCESGGNPRAISPDGRYRGKYQFSRATWRRLGGSGDPAKASEAEQDRIAAKLLELEGTKPWPACSARL